MKYLLITPSPVSLDYKVKGFNTTEEILEEIFTHGIGKETVVAERITLLTQAAQWTPEAVTEELRSSASG